jgi:hypothetical protein
MFPAQVDRPAARSWVLTWSTEEWKGRNHVAETLDWMASLAVSRIGSEPSDCSVGT